MQKNPRFATDDDALQFLQGHIPAPDQQKEIDMTPLREPLFEAPEDLKPGEYEFEGRNGLKVSFKLVKAIGGFDQYWQNLRHDDTLEGEARTSYAILDLTIRSPHFSYSLRYPDSQNHERINSIYWYPNLKGPASDLSHDYVNLGQRTIFLVDRDGFMARPLDLLGFMHEVGHIETMGRQPNDPETHTYSDLFGPKPRTPKMSAYELQREKDANSWLMENAQSLFEDLGIPAELVADFCNHVQLKSYHDFFRRLYLKTIE